MFMVSLLAAAVALTACSPAGEQRELQQPAQMQGQVAGAFDESARGPRTIQLDVPGFLPAVLVAPDGEGLRPLVVAAHGAGGSPDWECEYWRRLTRERAFVLCLRGTAMGGDSFYFKNHHALRDELAAATRQARARAPRIAPSSGIYAGFSQGASMGTLVVAGQAEQLPYVVLIEGFAQWDVSLGRSFARKGGKSVLFACGTTACATKAEKSLKALEQASVRARAKHAVGAGHTPVGPVQGSVEQNLAWLVAGDGLWQEIER